MKKLGLLFILFFGFSQARAIEVKIRLFSTVNVSQATVIPDTGLYYLLAYDNNLRMLDTIYDIYDEDSIRKLHFIKSGNQVTVKRGGESLGVYDAVRVLGSESLCDFKIEAGGKNRWYQDHLQIRVYDGFLQIVNIVDLEKYVAGVVESEGGHVDELEYFKAQAVLARTFALKNLDKHAEHGYNLKDDVTSQVYFSKCRYQNSSTILKAVLLTRDTIVVTPSCHPILGAFHANSGGQTVGSESAWMTSIEYLQPVQDSFSIGVGSYQWEKKLPKNEFYQYYATQLKVANTSELHKAILNFNQPQRESYFTFNGRKLKLTRIRFRFDLKSTNFTVKEAGNYVVLNGKGYGHGVGLSQDGAIEMARRGYNYKEIINFYFRDIELESYLRASLN